jgi:hypothetical protein
VQDQSELMKIYWRNLFRGSFYFGPFFGALLLMIVTIFLWNVFNGGAVTDTDTKAGLWVFYIVWPTAQVAALFQPLGSDKKKERLI